MLVDSGDESSSSSTDCLSVTSSSPSSGEEFSSLPDKCWCHRKMLEYPHTHMNQTSPTVLHNQSQSVSTKVYSWSVCIRRSSAEAKSTCHSSAEAETVVWSRKQRGRQVGLEENYIVVFATAQLILEHPRSSNQQLHTKTPMLHVAVFTKSHWIPIKIPSTNTLTIPIGALNAHIWTI